MPHPLPLFVALLMSFSIWCTPALYGANNPGVFPDHPINTIAVTNLAHISAPGQQRDLAKEQDTDSPSRWKRWEEKLSQELLATAKNLVATLLAKAGPQEVKKFVLHLLELLPLGDQEKLEVIVHRLVKFLDLGGVTLPAGELTALLLALGMGSLSAAKISSSLAAIGSLSGIALLGPSPMAAGLIVLVVLGFVAGVSVSEIWHLVKSSLG